MSEANGLPKGWEWTTVEAIAQTSTGGTPSRRQPDYFDGNIPWVKSGELGDSIVVETEESISQAAIENSSAKLFPKGTLCVALYGATVGKLGILGIDAATNQAICGIFLPPEINTRYLYYFLLSIRRNLIQQGKGGAQSNISNSIVRNTRFPVPPLNEQRRIVAKIEELFSDLDAGVAALERAKANLKRYRASVLKSAVEGRLTASWRAESPDVEPASELLKRLLAERRRRWEQDQLAKYQSQGKTPPKGWQDKYQEPKPPDTDNLPELPPNWCWATVEQLLYENSCNGISVRGSDDPPGVPALRLSAMSDHGFDYAIRRYIPIDDRVAQSLAITEGDFFVARGNGSLHLVGRGTLAQTPPDVVVFPDTIIRLRVFNGVRAFLATIWPSRFMRDQIERKARTSAGIYKISQRDIDGFHIPIPPSLEQNQIVSDVAGSFSVIEVTDRECASSLARATRLRQAILKRAFRGELVPQDPADEPAGELLARLSINGGQSK